MEWARLAIKRCVAKTTTERQFCRVTALSPGLRFGVHNNNLVNLVRGINERVFAVETDRGLGPPPRPDAGVFWDELRHFSRQFGKRVVVTTPWSHDEFVATYEGRRATIYRAAADSLCCEPVNRRDASSNAFMKMDKVPFYQKDDPAARLIHPRDPRYNVEVGVFIKKIEHDVYHAVDDVFGSRTILKGYNAKQVGGIMYGKWNRFRQPVGVGLDASRFDQHVSVDALRWEHAQYLKFFRGCDRERLATLLSWQLRTKVRARARDGSVKYEVHGMRFSGDMNTGLGNCLLMCAMVWSWARRQAVNIELANNGDDCVVVMEADDLARFDLHEMRAWFRTLGFTMKVETPVYDLEKIEFCQSHPINTGDGWLMVRKHRHAMAKDCVSLKPLNGPKVFDKWRLAVGLAGLSLTGGVPVQQDFYTAFMRGAKGAKLENDLSLETGFMRFARGMSRRYVPPSEVARYSYWVAFGVTPDEQVALEREYSTITPTWNPKSEMNDLPDHTPFLL